MECLGLLWLSHHHECEGLLSSFLLSWGAGNGWSTGVILRSSAVLEEEGREKDIPRDVDMGDGSSISTARVAYHEQAASRVETALSAGRRHASESVGILEKMWRGRWHHV